MTLIPEFYPRQIPSTLLLNQLVSAINILANLGPMSYQGAWNADTNTPELVSGVGAKGFYYEVSADGATEIDGIDQWRLGDKIAFNGDKWEKFDGGINEVLSVAGLVGAITKNALVTALSGTAAGDLVKLDGTGKLPAIDGSNLTNLASAPVLSVAGLTGAIAANTLVAALSLAISDISGLTAALAGKEAADANIIKANATKTLGAGYTATSASAGTKSSGTFTPNPASGNFQHATNNGAHTLAPPTDCCSIVVEYTNGASAGAISTGGFTIVKGAAPSTVNGVKYQAIITKSNSISTLMWVTP